MREVAHVFYTERLSLEQIIRFGLVWTNVDRTLSSLTLLEEELGFPFFGGMVLISRAER